MQKHVYLVDDDGCRYEWDKNLINFVDETDTILWRLSPSEIRELAVFVDEMENADAAKNSATGDGWIEYDGKGMPVDGYQMVEYSFGDGGNYTARADALDWSRSDPIQHWQITHYKIVS